ncbi:probable phosphoribosylformylglycinamidine synthase, chloroplastic/mitochondrial [Coffea arabica]|uniref:phosphoribosylformylglycinamidine synthase n=1 Tax=Coffea arabica TaxID=13443 RepID=A0ABM4U0T8_COFAR
MAASAWDITASEFLHGSCRQKLILPRHPPRWTNRLLWGTVQGKSHLRKNYDKGIRLRSHLPVKVRAVVSGNVGSSVDEKLSEVQGIGDEKVFHFYRVPLIQESATCELLKTIHTKISNQIIGLKTEHCFNIGLDSSLSSEKLSVLQWVLGETYEPENLGTQSFLDKEVKNSSNAILVEVGPRLSFTTAWSANAVSICRACGLTEINRMERSRRYLLHVKPGSGSLLDGQINEFAAMVHDRMTECVYAQKLTSFETNVVPEEVRHIPVMEKGREALEEINEQMGLAFDEQDLQYYTKLFRHDTKRNPTNVELFDIAQSNSEHSRHWFFTGKIVIDGKPMDRTLMQIVKSTLQANPNNSVIGFKDNSSAIQGFPVKQLQPVQPGSTCSLNMSKHDLDILFTAETHNFPCAVAPYPGAETGAGGRIRDTHATGRGSFVVASTAGYCVGNLNIEGSYAPWEDPSFTYPLNLASPLQILIDASNGASDYGNKFGEPLIQGYTRTFGMRLPSGERREWLKPIMFSGGIGQMDHIHITKGEPEVGMLVVKIGGPAYRIGMGGGAASSMVSGQNDAELDFNAVQRGDAEMAQKLYRVVRACIEMGEKNPIISIHDQGAGGNCNVVKEIIYPKGAKIDIRAIVVGDNTMSVLEIWGAEYQEQDAILVKPESRSLLQAICERERVSMAVIGTISGEGCVVLIDSLAVDRCISKGLPPPPPAEDLELEKVLGDMPQKTFEFHRTVNVREPLDIAPGITLKDSLKRVLRLPSVCSKRFLTTKVDRCVTGLVAQQQTVGPLQITLSDVAVIAQSYTDLTGGACSIGEQPIKGLLDPKAMARLAVGEALTNLVWAKVTSLADVKASGNWMYAAKMDGEGAAMYDAALALSEAMIELGIAIDGGKDSLSMAAHTSGEVVKAPGNLVISTYVTCPDITKTVTPDLKLGDNGILLHIDLAKGKRRLGGSALAQVFDQVGNECPDLDDVPYLKTVAEALPKLSEHQTCQEILPSLHIPTCIRLPSFPLEDWLASMFDSYEGNATISAKRAGFLIVLFGLLVAIDSCCCESSSTGTFSSVDSSSTIGVLSSTPISTAGLIMLLSNSICLGVLSTCWGVLSFCCLALNSTKTVFNKVQELLSEDLISAGHDISDGGLIVSALEMAFAGNCGISLDLTSVEGSPFKTLFAEELGLLLEVSKKHLDMVMAKLSDLGISAGIIGSVTVSQVVDVKIDGVTFLNEETSALRDIWEETSFQLEKFQRLASCVESEKDGLKYRQVPSWDLSFTPTYTDEKYMTSISKPKVAVIREEGSNGDREMAAAFYAAGFEPWDITMSDLLSGTISLHPFRGIVFVGGFSYADVLDSAKGWAASIRFNRPLLDQFQEFYERPDTFSLGVCNGCQLMALLGWVPGPRVGGVMGVNGDPSQPRFIHNESRRFECRFTSVRIEESPAMMFKGMEGSTLGVWAAHGEGRAFFPDEGVWNSVLNSKLAPVRYCDDDGKPTEVYPFNLNGSPLGVAAICSPDGRHLAMMPHPERCFLMWQFPWYPKHWSVDKKGPSPWLQMFQNAREWCS